MYNYVFLLGRLVRDIEINKTQDDKKVATMTLAVNKPFKNSETNTYDVDFINVTLWEQICEATSTYCKKGDSLAIKGRIQTRKEETPSGQNLYLTEIVAERVIFISSNKNTEN